MMRILCFASKNCEDDEEFGDLLRLDYWQNADNRDFARKVGDKCVRKWPIG